MDALMLGVMASFAEFEENLIRKRQVKGIALAKTKGKYLTTLNLTDHDVEQAQTMIGLGPPKTEIAA